MNWVWLFIILQLLNYNSAAPVELLQPDVTATLIVDEQSLSKKWESPSNGTEVTSSATDSLETAEELQNSTLQVKMQSQENSAVDEENVRTTQFTTTSQRLLESFTGHEQVFQGDILISRVSGTHSFDNSTKTSLAFLSNTTTAVEDPEVGEVTDGLEKVSFQNEEKDSNFTTHSSITSSTEMNDLKATTEANTEQTFVNNSEETTSYLSPETIRFLVKTDASTELQSKEIKKQDPILKQAVDSFIQDVWQIGSKLGFVPEQLERDPTTTEISDIEITKAPNLFSEALAAHEKPTEDGFQKDAENVFDRSKELLENTSGNSRILTKDFEQRDSKQEARFVQQNGTEGDDWIEATTEYEITEMPTSFSVPREKDIQNDSKQKSNSNWHTTTVDPNDGSDVTTRLGQPSDSFIYQTTTIGQSTEQAAEEVATSLPTVHLESQSSRNSEISANSFASGSHPESNQIPTFKEAIDSFVGDIVQIADSLHLSYNNTTNEQVPATTASIDEELNEDADLVKSETFANAIPLTIKTEGTESPAEITTSSVNLDNERDKTFAVTKAHSALVENVQGSAHNQSTERSMESLIEVTRESLIEEASMNFGKTARALFSQATAKSHDDISMENIARTEQGVLTEEKWNSSFTPFKTSEHTLIVSHEQEQKVKAISTTQDAINHSETFAENYERSYGKVEIPLSRNQVPEDKSSQLRFQGDSNEHKERPTENIDHKHITEIPSGIFGTTQQPVTYTYLDSISFTDENKAKESFETEVTVNEIEQKNQKGEKEENISSQIKQIETARGIIFERRSPINEPLQPNHFITTSFPVEQETSTNTPSAKEELTEEPSRASPTNQPEFSTLTPEELTTLSHTEETTVLNQNFEKEQQTAVNSLEETTHLQFEEFQNNLKEAFQKFTVLKTEHETAKPDVAITVEPGKHIPSKTTQDENESSAESSVSEAPHRSGLITQYFIDKFADNYEETFNKSTPLKETQSKQLESFAGLTETTTTATMSSAGKIKPFSKDSVEDSEDVTTMSNNFQEIHVLTTAENSSSEEIEHGTTEYISETTTPFTLVKVPLQRDINIFSLNAAIKDIVEVETTTEVQQINSEFMSTIQTTEPEEEAFTLPYPSSSQQEMVTFVANTNTTNKTTKLFGEKNHERLATTQRQETLTRSSFMVEQQQQLESTTEFDEQTTATSTSEQTAATTNGEETQTEQQTTEAEINSTTVMEENEATMATMESEARSLSLPPPKLEYSQSDDGVEVFYGYSIVKHN